MIDKKLEVTNLITPLINSYKLISDEWKNLFEIGISEYLNTQTEKYYFTNTFLHRGDKIVFDNIYFPIKAKYKKLISDFSNLESIFENYKNVTIIGSAGSGKTTLMKYVFLNSIRTTKKIPILIELRFLNQFNGDFEKLICEKILKSKVKPSADIFKRSLESGNFLFLLDGYDEIFSSKKQELNRQIELFVDSYSKNNFFITTRPGSGIENFPRFHDFKVCDLSNEDVEGFIKKIVDEEERSSRILSIINEQKNATYLEYLRNPLLLSMFILAIESHPEIPSRKSSFYRNVFDTLYSKHDGITKNSFPREKLTKFEREEFEKILNIFSYITTIEGEYSFTHEYLTDILNKVLNSTSLKCVTEDLIYDLQTTISILILDGFEYNFPHRSMQEYFTAQFIANLPSEKKQKAYENLQEVLIKSSADHSFHLWSICQEIDETAFTSFFLIPQLKKYEEELNIDSDTKLLNHYLKLIDASIFYDNFRDSKNSEKEMIIYRTRNFYCSLNNFCGAYSYNDFASFTQRENVKTQLLAILINQPQKKSENSLKELFITRDVKKILLKNNITKVIKSNRKSIQEKIKSLENKIENDKNKIDNILNF